MDLLKRLANIPIVDFLIILGVILLLALGVFLSKRLRSKKEHDKHASPPRWLVISRLTGFAIFSLVLISFVLMVVKNYQLTVAETNPTPSLVEIPDGLPFEVEEITFLSEENKIAGWFVPSQNGATVILLHGYGGNRLGTRPYAEMLTNAGYGVLMYDERASGESEGERRSYGWEDAADVEAALDYLASRPEVDAQKIGIGGCSMGGQIALQGAAYNPEIVAVWADGPATIRAIDTPNHKSWKIGIYKVSNHMLDWIYAQHLDIEAPAAMIDIIGNIAPRPIMLVGGGSPNRYGFTEIPEIEKYAQYAGDNAEAWIIDEAVHCDGPAHRPEEYATRLVGFFDQAFGIQTTR
jgi:dienelactone hydrolase